MWDWLGAAGFTRSDVVVGIGGGTITDVAGFCSATWLRGVDWIAIPTTLAGMVDASVGGKTGVNSEYGKNLIGAFHSPRRVIIDSNWLKTLPTRDIAAGLAEVIKTGFIADSTILDLMRNFDLNKDRDNTKLLDQLIEKSISVKARVVSTDFKESYEREVLNYGHTLGHAVEIHSKFSLRHGEAVSIGLVFAAHLSAKHCGLSESDVSLHIELLKKIGLPISYDRAALPQLSLHENRAHHLEFPRYHRYEPRVRDVVEKSNHRGEVIDQRRQICPNVWSHRCIQSTHHRRAKP
jgi:3-dehydroquinate synthase